MAEVASTTCSGESQPCQVQVSDGKHHEHGAKFNINLELKQFHIEEECFLDYQLRFNAYCNLMDVPNSKKVDLFLAVADYRTLRRINTLNLTEEDKQEPGLCFEKIQTVLLPPGTKSIAEFGCLRVRQREDESIVDFAARLYKNFELSNPGKKEKMEPFLRDAFVFGLTANEIAFDMKKALFMKEVKTFTEAYKRALLLEGVNAVVSHRTSTDSKGNDRAGAYHVTQGSLKTSYDLYQKDDHFVELYRKQSNGIKRSYSYDSEIQPGQSRSKGDYTSHHKQHESEEINFLSVCQPRRNRSANNPLSQNSDMCKKISKPVCIFCSKKGHTEANCHKRHRSAQRTLTRKC
jgi:hypothetical protein